MAYYKWYLREIVLYDDTKYPHPGRAGCAQSFI